MPNDKKRTTVRRFEIADRSSVPTGRNGKHKAMVAQILSDLEGLDPGECLKIPLSELSASKVNVRSALNRASHKLKQSVATAADDKFLYVWNS